MVRRRGETNRTIWAKVSFKIAETEQPYQVKRMIGGIGDMFFSIYSQTENVYDPTVSLVNHLWARVRTIRELFLVSRTGDDPLPSVCAFKTSPCVRPTHVETHVRVVPVHTGTI